MRLVSNIDTKFRTFSPAVKFGGQVRLCICGLYVAIQMMLLLLIIIISLSKFNQCSLVSDILLHWRR